MALLRATRRAGCGRKVPPSMVAVACRHLAKADPVMRRLIAQLGPCVLSPRRHYFAVLCDSIIAQQVSASVAAVIFRRFSALYHNGRPTPRAVLAMPLARLRQAGLSRQKAAYIKDLAAGFLDGRIPRSLGSLSNEELIAALVSIHGIGRWTAEMFLIFSLNRPDVLPVDDLGIRKALQRCYGLRRLPTAEGIRRLAKLWHPYETFASWYLWRSLHR